MKTQELTRRSFLSTASTCLAAGAVPGLGWSAPASPALKASVFTCEVTPPVGSPLEECTPPVATSIDVPLQAKGVVLDDGRTRYAFCAFDYCELRVGAHDLVRRKLADALGVNELQVEVHCLHQHDAPLYDITADMLLDVVSSPQHLGDPGFLESVSDRVASAARGALGELQPCTHVGTGRARVERFASNRRVLLPDGRIGVRFSSCTDPVLIAAPEGLIDPWVRTVTLFNQDRPIVRLHYYASHPQSYYGKGHINPDTIGLAREQMEKEEGVRQIYFTGCAGNVAPGKYNDGSHERRAELAGRLQDGMRKAIAATERTKVTAIQWKTAEVRFPQRTEPEYSEAHLREVMLDAKQPNRKRVSAGLALSWYERLKERPAVDISYYRIGPARILHLPGEPFVEYQLYAQSLHPNEFVAVAGYGEGGMGYICMDKSAAEGGYEPTASLIGRGGEERLKRAIREVSG